MIEINNLFFSYKNLKIFEDFNFQSDSDVIIFKGPSGSGKSTFLKILSANIKNFQSQSLAINDNVLLILQEDALCPWLTGLENITRFIRYNEQLTNDPFYRHTQNFISKKAFEMSFGQRRMIEILRSLVINPDVLMLDEPFNYIDPLSRKLITEALLDFSGRKGKKLILTSHYKEDFLSLNPATYLFDGSFPLKKLAHEVTI